MKIQQGRKAFTIVELVIVIAVIAVLSTVLVPTFGNMIGNAVDSAAKQAAKNAFTSYLTRHPEQSAAHFLYEADGRFVTLDNGAATGVYETQAEAMKAMLDDPDTDADESLQYTATAAAEGLYACARRVLPDVAWELGSIHSSDKTGTDFDSDTRLRTAGHLLLSDFGGVSIRAGWQVIWIAYWQDGETYRYAGHDGFLDSGKGFTIQAIREKCPQATHFRVVLCAVGGGTLTTEGVTASGVTFYLPGETVPTGSTTEKLSAEQIAAVKTGMQDGAIYNGKLFLFNGSGKAWVYDLQSKQELSSFTLDSVDVLSPHANSVVFSDTFYEDGDRYPLLYVNIYNNYAGGEDKKEGTCCVYRLTEDNGSFSTELVQVIRVGFAKDALWSSNAGDSNDRPYGNFAVDGSNLYAFVMRNGDSPRTTRIFRFDLPDPRAGTYNAAYGCPEAVLERGDICQQFDTEFFCIIQGCTARNGKLWSLEGAANGLLKVVDIQKETVIDAYALGELGLTKEPEMIGFDPADGKLYYADGAGGLYLLSVK